MPLPIIKNYTPTIEEVWLYTYRLKKTRFENMERDILPSKIKVINRLVYKKNKEGKTSAPDERLQIISYSAPQYGEYIRGKGKNVKRQMKVKHHYDTTMSLLKDSDGNFSFQSKILWRVGSNKKWDSKPSQTKIKAIYTSTRVKLKKKFTDKKTGKLNKILYNKEIELIKKKGKYLSVGDYNSQERGINGDFYWRQMPLCYAYNCLYGPLTQDQFDSRDRDTYPFFGKHEISIIMYMLKKGILKK